VAAELTELHQAIAEKSLRKVNALIRGGVDVNGFHPQADFGYPISHAMEAEDLGIIRSLLKAGANPNIEDYLARSIKRNNLSLAKALIDYGADLDGQPTWEKDEFFETNLMRTTRLGRYAFVKLLLEAGANPNRHNAENESALFIAHENNHKRLIKLLEPYVSEREREWVDERCSQAYEERLKLDQQIYKAIHAGETERVLKLIDSSKRSIDALLEPERGSPLEEALSAYESARIATSPQPSCSGLTEWRKHYNPDYRHPNVIATRNTVHALLDRGASPETLGWKAPLSYLGQLSERPEDIELGIKLIDKANDINAPTTCEKSTALFAVTKAGQYGYSAVLTKKLLEKGADPNARNCYGESVLQKARESEKWHGPNPCIPLLIEAGAEE